MEWEALVLLDHQSQLDEIKDRQAWQDLMIAGEKPEAIIRRERAEAEADLAAERAKRKWLIKFGAWLFGGALAGMLVMPTARVGDNSGAALVIFLAAILITGLVMLCYFALRAPKLRQSYCWKMAEKMLDEQKKGGRAMTLPKVIRALGLDVVGTESEPGTVLGRRGGDVRLLIAEPGMGGPKYLVVGVADDVPQFGTNDARVAARAFMLRSSRRPKPPIVADLQPRRMAANMLLTPLKKEGRE